MQNKIYDSDRHVIEPTSIWTDYVDQNIVKDFPISLKYNQDKDRNLPPQYMIGPFTILKNWDSKTQVASAIKSGESRQQRLDAMQAESQLRTMDDSGIFSASLFPTFAGYIVNHQEIPSEVSVEYAKGYNRWLKDYCSLNPTRLKAIGMVSRHDPDSMKSQLQHIISLGWTCVTLRPEVILGRSLGDNGLNEFWQACADNDISIALHGSTNLHAPTVGTDRYTSRFALHACSHSMEIQMAFLSLLESGVLERFPALKFGFFEAGASWIPHWLWRLDNICYPEFPQVTDQNIKMLPSEYFKRQCWVAIEVEEPCLTKVIELIGHEKLLFGTDFPHPDHLHFDTSELLACGNGIPKEMFINILENNPKSFFG